MELEQLRLVELALLRRKAYDAAYSDKWKRAYGGYFGTEMGFEELIANSSEKDTGIMMAERKKTQRGVKYAFIVVNPMEGVLIKNFIFKIKKACNKVWIKRFMWQLEQRGKTEDDMGMGMHCNILVETNRYKKRSEIQREMYNTFKRMVGNGLHVCIRCGNDSGNFERYMRGEKEEDKMEAVMIDRTWREELGLEEFVGNWFDDE